MRISGHRWPRRPAAAYMLMEALVYIGLVVLVLGLAFALLYRLVDNSVVLRRGANDVAAAMTAGERWRADVRKAETIAGPEVTEDGTVWRLTSAQRVAAYRFDGSNVWLRVDERPWVRLVQNVRSSEMRADTRDQLTAWQWELEMGPRTKGYVRPGRFRPLFTFTAVPAAKIAP